MGGGITPSRAKPMSKYSVNETQKTRGKAHVEIQRERNTKNTVMVIGVQQYGFIS